MLDNVQMSIFCYTVTFFLFTMPAVANAMLFIAMTVEFEWNFVEIIYAYHTNVFGFQKSFFSSVQMSNLTLYRVSQKNVDATKKCIAL